MKITDIKSYIVSPIPGSPWVFVEVETDEGITGLGECSDYRSGPMLVAGIEAVKAMVIGEDPAHIDEIWQRIFRQYSSLGGRGFISHLISGIDIALWDIRGQVLGQPIYLGRLSRIHSHLEGIIGDVVQQFRARCCDRIFPGLLHWAIELDKVVAPLSLSITGNSQPRR